MTEKAYSTHLGTGDLEAEENEDDIDFTEALCEVEDMMCCANGAQYEGEMMRNEREGRGKLSFRSGTVYEGEFKQNLCHGEGIQFWTNGKKCYEGQWVKGWWHGKGKEFCFDGSLRYEGEFNENCYDGEGIKFWKKRFCTLKDSRGCWVAEVWCGEKEYEGQWRMGKMHGEGEIFWIDGILRYKGQFKEGLLDGEATEWASC